MYEYKFTFGFLVHHIFYCIRTKPSTVWDLYATNLKVRVQIHINYILLPSGI